MSLIDVEGFQMVQTHLNLLVDAVGNQSPPLSTPLPRPFVTPILHAAYSVCRIKLKLVKLIKCEKLFNYFN